MLAFFKKLLLVVLLAALVLFAYQNLEPLSRTMRFSFDLYTRGWKFDTPDLPLVFLFVVFFLFGMLAAGFHGVYERMARRAEIRRRDKHIRALEKEMGELRAQVAELRPPPAEQPPQEVPGEPRARAPEKQALPEPAHGSGEEPPSPKPAAASAPEEEPTL